jgi:hypothetical protein
MVLKWWQATAAGRWTYFCDQIAPPLHPDWRLASSATEQQPVMHVDAEAIALDRIVRWNQNTRVWLILAGPLEEDPRVGWERRGTPARFLEKGWGTAVVRVWAERAADEECDQMVEHFVTAAAERQSKVTINVWEGTELKCISRLPPDALIDIDAAMVRLASGIGLLIDDIKLELRGRPKGSAYQQIRARKTIDADPNAAIKVIARAAGVSSSTVKRALRNARSAPPNFDGDHAPRRK